MLYVGLRNAAESTWSWITTFPLSFRTNSICKNVNKLAVSVLLHSCFQALVFLPKPLEPGFSCLQPLAVTLLLSSGSGCSDHPIDADQVVFPAPQKGLILQKQKSGWKRLQLFLFMSFTKTLGFCLVLCNQATWGTKCGVFSSSTGTTRTCAFCKFDIVRLNHTSGNSSSSNKPENQNSP